MSLQQPAGGDARERVLESAEKLFAERGYQNVTLRDIAQSIGIRHASLYYHFPDGKEEMYVKVTERRMQRYRTGLQWAIKQADDDDWQAQLRAAGLWLLKQPHMHLTRMMQSDMPIISATAAEELRYIVRDAILKPLDAIFRQALAHNPRPRQRSMTLAGMFVSLIEGIDNLPRSYVTESPAGTKEELVEEVLDLIVHGIHTDETVG